MRAVELFAGAGGMSLGLQRAGIEVMQAYDAWEPAVEIYRRNVGPHVWRQDLKDILSVGPMIAALAPDIICGGPPCQDFSAAGQRVEGERAALTRAYAMLVCIARPAWFVMENVPLAASSQAWVEARTMLMQAGYGLTETKLDASFYRVPQRRRRLFVIGRLGEQDGFLESALAAVQSDERMTVREMLETTSAEDVELVKAGAFFTRPYLKGRGVRTVDESAGAVIRTTRERPRPKYLANPHPDDPVPATQAAVLSQAQVARIQGFPVDWDWSSATSRDVDQMIANAVPPPLAEAIGRVILAREAGNSIPEIQGRFGQWLRRRGFSKASVRNAKTRLNRARRLLGGRTFADVGLEIAAIETVEGFLGLPVATRSDLRAALRLYREWQETAGKMRTKSGETVGVAGALAA